MVIQSCRQLGYSLLLDYEENGKSPDMDAIDCRKIFPRAEGNMN
jgi:hypothetical protein